MDNKILIAYFLRKGNEKDSTSFKIAEKIGSEIAKQNFAYQTFAITPVEEYPEEKENFEMVTKLEAERRSRPAITSKFSGMKDVKYLVLVAPNWWNDLPMAVYTFLDQYDFAEKKIVPVILHGGDGGKKITDSLRSFLHKVWVLPAVDVDNTAVETFDASKVVEELFKPSDHEW